LIISKTPLRISLAGGGTDFPNYYEKHSGKVLTTAIDKYVYVILKPRYDHNIRIGYSVTENVEKLDDLKHELAREAIRMFGIDGIEISMMSDLPGGSGLGSSSSVTVGLLHALYAYTNNLVSMKTLAEMAICIETKILNKPIGIQDQIVAAYGDFIFARFDKNEFYVTPVFILDEYIDILEKSLLLFFTGLTRNASDVLEEQTKNIDNNIESLNNIYNICGRMEEELSLGNIYKMGELLDESWQLKKKLASKVSNENIDNIYEYAKTLDPSIGGKLCGAGSGGHLLLYCPPKKQKYLITILENRGLRHIPFHFSKYGSQIIFNQY
jgi:D-glycero-alpha-D-manno-heptose-7-phosphate kinase